MQIEKLIWDSYFFKLIIGKLAVINEDDFNPALFKEQAMDGKYELIYVFKFNTPFSENNLKHAKLELVDIMLTMSQKLKKDEYLNLPYDFRTDLSREELMGCYYIAEETAVISRFYTEPKIGAAKARALYRELIDNALNRSFSDGLFLVKEADSVVGIHLIKTDAINNIGVCTLIGVNPEFKRSGIGSALWRQSFSYWATEKEIDVVKVPFSFQNRESFNFHLKMGFNRVEEIKYIYHFRNKI